MTADTIYALSSGSPPAAIAVVRISGPRADAAVEALAGKLPPPRRARVAELRHEGDRLDEAIILRFPGPRSATGEDVAELHLHGGRAVVSAVLQALSALDGLRPAEPGEFTRRAFENGRIDLAEAEGLADLLQAETQQQRRAALVLAGGALSRLVDEWQGRILALAAALEAALDFADEGDVGESLPEAWRHGVIVLAEEIGGYLGRPAAERLRDGIRVVIAGPPNAGKSTLLNALVGREAAITSAIPGTTRDRVEAPTAIGGTPFLLIDTAGLRESSDEIEVLGVARAEQSIAAADLILWLGEPEQCPDRSRSIIVSPKADVNSFHPAAEVAVSGHSGFGLDSLVQTLLKRSEALLPQPDEIAINARHRATLHAVHASLQEAAETSDLLIGAEALRQARLALDKVTGRAGVEDMLDALFGRFCIGK